MFFAKKEYPGTHTGFANMATLGTALSNTIMDPMVNKMLYESGFDLVAYLKKGFELQLPIFRNFPEESRLDLFQRHFLKCLIIEKELEWEIINEDALVNEFKKVYQVKYPLIYNEAIDFIGYVKEKGMDTPEKVRELFIKLRADNRMEQYIEIM